MCFKDLKMTTMTQGERVRAALKGEQVDRVPFCFWHHFKPDGSGERMAELTYEFFVQKFNLDIVKIMPDLPYPEPAAPLVDAEQVRMLPRLTLDEPIFQEQLTCIRLLRERLGEDYPIILTLFSPLTYALRFFSERQQALKVLRGDPQAFTEGLGTIAHNLRILMQAAIEAGASGIFFSSMGATTADLTREEYASYGRPYDLQALEGAAGGWLNIIHVHANPDQNNDQIYFEAFIDYPVTALSWSDRLTGPNLEEASQMTDKALMAGLWERGPLTHGGESELQNEILSAISQGRGKPFILANGCSIPDDNPEEWLYAARRLVDNLT
jgi:uroporphyrinogen decarboxylase